MRDRYTEVFEFYFVNEEHQTGLIARSVKVSEQLCFILWCSNLLRNNVIQ